MDENTKDGMNRARAAARELLDALAEEFGSETFVADGYAYYHEAEAGFAMLLTAAEERGFRRGVEASAAVAAELFQGFARPWEYSANVQERICALTPDAPAQPQGKEEK